MISTHFHQKMNNHPRVHCHHCHIWPLVLPLDPSYTLPVHLLLFSVNLLRLLTFHFPLPRLFQRLHPMPRPLLTLRNKFFFFYGEELLTPRPTPKLGNQVLSAVGDCLLNPRCLAERSRFQGRTRILISAAVLRYLLHQNSKRFFN